MKIHASMIFGIGLLVLTIFTNLNYLVKKWKTSFTSINFRTKNRFGKFNSTPSLKFDYGVTQLSEMTDFINNPNDLMLEILFIKKILFKVETCSWFFI